MSKNILIVSSSPREGGNSDFLCDEFMRGALDAGHQVEKIRIAEKNINYCTGCCTCIRKPGACIQRDDMNAIFDKMINADMMVLATPVYFHSLNGQMKTFIDRVCPIYHKLNDIEVYFIIASAGGRAVVESTADSLRRFTECLHNSQEKGILSVTGVWDVGAVKNKPAIEQAYTMGKNS